VLAQLLIRMLFDASDFPTANALSTVNPVESADPKNAPVTPLESADPKSLDLKSFRIRTSKIIRLKVL
jgi:hypothetical protein